MFNKSINYLYRKKPKVGLMMKTNIDMVMGTAFFLVIRKKPP